MKKRVAAYILTALFAANLLMVLAAAGAGSAVALASAPFARERTDGYVTKGVWPRAAKADTGDIDVSRLSLGEMVKIGKTIHGGYVRVYSTDALRSYFPGIPVSDELLGGRFYTAVISMYPPLEGMKKGVVTKVDVIPANILRISLTYNYPDGSTACVANVSAVGIKAMRGQYKRQISTKPERYAIGYDDSDRVLMLIEKRDWLTYAFLGHPSLNMDDALPYLEQDEVQAFIAAMNGWITGGATD